MRLRHVIGPTLCLLALAGCCHSSNRPTRDPPPGIRSSIEIRWTPDRFWPADSRKGGRRFAISCVGAAATVWKPTVDSVHVLARRICRQIERRPKLLEPVGNASCTMQSAAYGEIRIVGTHRGQRVAARFNGAGGCEIARYRAMFGTTLDAAIRKTSAAA